MSFLGRCAKLGLHQLPVLCVCEQHAWDGKRWPVRRVERGAMPRLSEGIAHASSSNGLDVLTDEKNKKNRSAYHAIRKKHRAGACAFSASVEFAPEPTLHYGRSANRVRFPVGFAQAHPRDLARQPRPRPVSNRSRAECDFGCGTLRSHASRAETAPSVSGKLISSPQVYMPVGGPVPAARKGWKREPPPLAVPLGGKLPQSEAKRYIPEGSHIWKAHTTYEWRGELGEYKPVSSPWIREGEEGSMWIVIKRLWEQWLETRGKDTSHCPIQGLFHEVYTPTGTLHLSKRQRK